MNNNYVIAITRTCGSGATSISKILGERLGINVYDRNLLRLASDDSGINEELFARADEHMKQSLLYRISRKVYNGEIIPPDSNDFTSNDNLFNYQAKVLKELAANESFICIGRAADYILKPIQEEELYKIIGKVIGEWKKSRNEKEKVKLLQSEVKKLKKEKQIDYKSDYDSEKYSKSVRNVLSYIEENYHQDISLESAATEVFMNKNYLSSLFCNEMGVGFTKYLSDFRLKKAKILLRETELNINEIANMTGFATANYFVRVFKKQENCTPKEYRIMEERKLK